jgi:hypothetical protein
MVKSISEDLSVSIFGVSAIQLCMNSEVEMASCSEMFELFTHRYGIIAQKTLIFNKITVRTSSLTEELLPF